MYTLDCWRSTAVFAEPTYSVPITITMPARFDFIGGWTDTPPYFFDNVSCVLNATLVLANESGHTSRGNIPGAAITVTVRPSERYLVTENNRLLSDISSHIVLAKTFEFLTLESPKVSIDITNSIPHGSGLGGSSLLTASLLGALTAYYRGVDYLQAHLSDLVNNVLYIEQMMGSGGGWQDQIGGLFPGVKLIATNPEEPCCYSIDYLDRGINLLNERSLVIDTRMQRKAKRILVSIRQKYVDRDPLTVRTLAAIARNARLGFRLLADLDIRSFAELLSDSWRMVNEVESGSVEVVERLRSHCRGDIIGMKIGGAGGGGFILVIFEDRERKEHHCRFLRNEFPECIVYDPIFGGEGMAVYPGAAGEAHSQPLYRATEMQALRCSVHHNCR